MEFQEPSSSNPDQPNYEVNIEQTWNSLKEGLDHIYSEEFTNISKQKYIELYTHVYSFCSIGGLYSVRIKRCNGSMKHLGEKLYNKLNSYLSTYLSLALTDVCQLNEENLLTGFSDRWRKYQRSTKVLDGICSYLNRHWVQREIEEGTKGVYSVYRLAIVLWKSRLFLPLNASITKTVLKLIETDRNGENIVYSILNKTLNCYIQCGIVEDDPLRSEVSLNVYKEFFEQPFLRETESYYIKQSALFLKQNTFSEYMGKVETALSDEKRRVQLYLHNSTLGALSQICEHVLIGKHIELFYSEFQNFLSNDKHEDVERLYNLVCLVPNTLKELKNLFESHVYKRGTYALESCANAAVNDPTLYVQTILNVHRKYHHLVLTAFHNETGFSSCMDKACENFINNNAVTKLANSPNKSPLLLAQYTDLTLKKTSKNLEESELDEVLNHLTTILKYINDKDVFQKFYGKFLANRLLQDTSSSQHGETYMIYKLKELCGYEYVYKLNRLFTDMESSKETNEMFGNYLNKSDKPLNLTCNVKVLCQAFWPDFEDKFQFSLPREIENAVTVFTLFFADERKNRKLRWLYNKSKGEVVTNCFNNRYIFQANTFQIALLLQYNEADSFTISQLQQLIQTNNEPLVGCIKSLVNSKLLVLEKENEELNSKSVVSLSLNYKNRKLRVNINVPIKWEVKKDEEITYENIEIQRSIVIQATIVRIMKTRKSLKHQDLIAEVLGQMSSKFKPTVQHIKKAINILIEREYLKRSSNDNDVYEYI